MSRTFTQFIRSHIQTGNLTLSLPDGSQTVFGNQTGRAVSARITDRRTIRRLLLNPELALGEAYMDGTFVVEEGSIYDFLELVFTNTDVDKIRGIPKLVSRGVSLINRVTGHNSVLKSKSNVAHHYDLSGDLYRLFLDSDSQYSCAYFESADDSLEQAQLAKKRHIAAKMVMQPGQRVLDIGSGWGGLSLYMAKHYDANVVGVTLSEEQYGVSNDRARSEGLSEQVKFDLKDYRDVSGRFDRIVSVGMFEHVGSSAYEEFFAKVAELLTDDGVMLLHYIGNTRQPSPTNSWILKYIFPGGYIPSLSEVLPVIERHGLVVTDIETLRLHYAETLRHWREKFLAQWNTVVELYDERFARMWEFYLASSESAFRYQGLVIHQIQLAKRQEAVPTTRAYIEPAEDALRASEMMQEDKDTGIKAERSRVLS